MALNPRYVTAPSLQEYFVDKDSGLPLSGGKVFFFRDNNRTEYKTVYELQGNEANYTYAPLPNPVILSAVGTMQDNNGNDIIPYYYPFDANGDADLYYIVVQNSLGVPQFTRQAWPNPGINDTPGDSDSRFNYIPNGQLLAHTVLPDNTLVPGSNIVAQGGFSVELPGDATSVNTLEFIANQFTQAPPQSPRYTMQISCSSFVPSEEFKNIRVKFTDVNKFSTKPGAYTFAFWATSNVSLPVAINVYKYFGAGGSAPFSVTQALDSITTAADSTLYQYTIDFGLNNLYTTGDDQDDYVAIDIALPTNIGFQARFSDFVLFAGEGVPVVNFPVQTDADMMSRGVMGWADKVDPNGFDLYLPPILTKQGMTWDNSQVATVGMDVAPIDDPKSTSPFVPQHNKMPCDGASYINTEYSANGIPFARLGQKLLEVNQGAARLPLYGTGVDYVSALVDYSGAQNNTLRISYNKAGAGSALASDGGGATGFTFSSIYTYNGSTTGIATLNTFCSNTGTSNVILLAMQNGFSAFASPSAGTSGFTVTRIDNNGLPNSLLAFQGDNCGALITTVSGAALQVVGAGRYWSFSSNTTQYFMWFNVNGANTVPAGPGTPIEVKISSTQSAADVADVVREAVLGLNSTLITIPGVPPAGSWFLFSSNPGAVRNFYIWFTVNGGGTDPNVPGATGIKCELFSGSTATEIRDAIQTAVNSYQYASPDFRGMFPRFADPTGLWDFDVANRVSSVPTVGGGIPGTFEFSQFLQHTHTYERVQAPGASVPFGGDFNNTAIQSGASGGSETRPVNTYVYPFIRY